MNEARRSTAARIGVTLFNILVPGLGLLRIGNWAAALLFALTPVAWLLSMLGIAASASDVDYAVLMVIVILSLLLITALYVGSMVLTWRRSRDRTPLRWWSRWYSLIGFVLAYQILTWPLTPLIHRYYKPYYIPSEGMLPTLRVGDRLIAKMGQPESVDRGDVVLVLNAQGHVYIKRVAGLPGDRIALVRGTVIINGRPVTQRLVGRETVTDFDGPIIMAKLEESFPGEAGKHLLHDAGSSVSDEFEEVTVAPAHIFLLGDNRDRSADSRIPKPMGLEQVPLEDVVGRAILVTWSSDPARRGLRLN